jgi:hypothetical protein
MVKVNEDKKEHGVKTEREEKPLRRLGECAAPVCSCPAT